MINKMFVRTVKATRLLKRRAFVRAAAEHRVAAAVEHLRPIRLTEAATLVDIGANKGQFSLAFRALRPDADIVAFEPLPDAGDTFRAVFRDDPRTTLMRSALAAASSEADFFVTDRHDSSSLLRPGMRQAEAFGIRQEAVTRVPVRRLDECVDLARCRRPVLIKIDVQGAELEVLRGSTRLEFADYIYVELSFVELYDEQPKFQTVAAYLADQGFELAGVYNQVETYAFGPTQADFLFKQVTTEASKKPASQPALEH